MDLNEAWVSLAPSDLMCLPVHDASLIEVRCSYEPNGGVCVIVYLELHRDSGVDLRKICIRFCSCEDMRACVSGRMTRPETCDDIKVAIVSGQSVGDGGAIEAVNLFDVKIMLSGGSSWQFCCDRIQFRKLGGGGAPGSPIRGGSHERHVP